MFHKFLYIDFICSPLLALFTISFFGHTCPLLAVLARWVNFFLYWCSYHRSSRLWLPLICFIYQDSSIYPPLFVYCWLLSCSMCWRLILLKQSLLLWKNQKEERKICPLVSETVEHHFNGCSIFYSVDVPYFIYWINILLLEYNFLQVCITINNCTMNTLRIKSWSKHFG